MFPVFYSICRQTSIFKTEMCTLYWYLRSRTTNPWCYWHTKTVETWNCEAEVNPYVLWERLEVTWHSCIPTTAVVQAFSLFPIFEDRSPFLPSVFSPAGNQLALQRQIEALPWGGVLCDWQTCWNKAILTATQTIYKFFLVTIPISPTMQEVFNLAFNAA